VFDFASLWYVIYAWLLLIWDTIQVNSVSDWVTAISALYGWIIKEIQPHLNSLITLASLSFGLLKWYRSRESELFRRLGLAIEREERNLRDARDALATIMLRPGPAKPVKVPLYLARPLAAVMSRTRWRPFWSARWLPMRIDRKLKRAIEHLTTIEKNAEARLSFCRAQLASAHVILGALDAGRAGLSNDHATQTRLNDQSRGHFIEATNVHGMEADAELVFHVGHQLLKTNDFVAALVRFERLELLAEEEKEGPAKTLLKLRAATGQAHCKHQKGNLDQANKILKGFVDELPNLAPLRDRDLLEKAELHELHGTVRRELNYDNARESFDRAQRDYDTIVAQVAPRRGGFWRSLVLLLRQMIGKRTARWVGDRQRELVASATKGSLRCKNELSTI
jgi:hypothetical protein